MTSTPTSPSLTSTNGSPDLDPGVAEGDGSAKEIQGLSPSQLAMRRLLRDKLTMGSAIIAAIFVILAILSPILVSTGVLNPNEGHMELLDANSGFLPSGGWGGMSWSHPLGVDPGAGRDVMSRLFLGITTSLTIALSAAVLAVIIGTIVGIISGYLGGWADFWLNRLIDLTLSFPQTLMLLALSGQMIDLLVNQVHIPAGDLANGTYVALVLALFGWPNVARLIRGQVLSQREREYVEAARSLGAKNSRIYFRELLPNLWAPILVYGTLILPAYVSAEAALSYLGVGIKPPTPTLGNILADSTVYSVSDPTYFFFPSFFLALVVLSFNLLGDGLRDALDPKANR